MDKEVFIVGAGTAGLILARELSKKGISCTVFDQKKQPGTPASASGIISINGLKSIKTGYEDAVTNTLYGARLHAGKNTMSVMSKTPVAYILDRVLFNKILLNEAKEAGAKINLGKRITNEELDELSSKGIVVGADGAVSTVAKHFSMGSVDNYVLTYKAEYEITLDDIKNVDLFFDKDNSKGLFAWLCPNSDKILEIGVGVNSEVHNSKVAFERFVSKKEISERIADAMLMNENASIIPMKLRKKIVDDEKNVLLVGDAAGQIKPSTGGGIVFGGNAAIIASEVISKHIKTGIKLSEYEKIYKKKYVFDTKLHNILNKFYTNIGENGLGLTIRVLNNLGMSGFLSQYGDMDSPKNTFKNAFLRKRAR
ncbi:MAG: geranylgeranyl reductase family protein [Candidatus Micrarchaeia archaeon]